MNLRCGTIHAGQASRLGNGRSIRVGLALIVLLLALAYVPTARTADLRVVTEEFPPYDFTDENGEVQGFATEVVRQVLAKLEIDVEIEVFPWARALKLASENPNTMLFSVVRTQEREDLFHWVGVVCEVRSFLYRLRSRQDIVAGKLSDLRKYDVGVVRGWAGQKYLENSGFPNLQAVAVSDLNIKKLLNGRVDLIEDYEANLIFRMKRLGYDPSILEKVYFNEDISGPLYAVFSQATPEDVVRRFKDAFAAVHLNGSYDSIRSRWLDLD